MIVRVVFTKTNNKFGSLHLNVLFYLRLFIVLYLQSLYIIRGYCKHAYSDVGRLDASWRNIAISGLPRLVTWN